MLQKENNTDSYACALRDVGREYAEMDSLSHALHILIVADSVANKTKISKLLHQSTML